MKIFENKVICIILMVVLIAGGLFVGGAKGLNGLYKDVAEVFFVGIDNDGICVANDMSERISAATNMVTVARKYESTVPASCRQAIDYVNTAAASVDSALNARDIAEAVAANKILDTAVADLYREMGDLSLSDKDEDYRQNLYADFNSRNDTISHDPYNQYAQEYMAALDGFPAGLIAAIMPIKEAAAAY
ncbi:MAG: hypothetical protein IJB73_08150 [Firmicutes bacterium]|nr:hypothetical protein [Bacillota bacterium]